MAAIIFSDNRTRLTETLEKLLGAREAYYMQCTHREGLSAEQLYEMLQKFNMKGEVDKNRKSVELLPKQMILGSSAAVGIAELRFVLYVGRTEIYAFYNNKRSKNYLFSFLRFNDNLRQITGAGP
jgi:hypothetical protein